MKIALIGNPNSGKTSLFNRITGSNQKIGNWPGVTIEKKEGKIIGLGDDLVDLPGVYSLFPYTDEEIVSKEFLMKNKPDLVINIIDSTALERSLYLTTQLMDLGVKMIIVLNMLDLLFKKGIEIKEDVLAKELGIPVLKVSAKTGQGIDQLIEEIKKQKTQNKQNEIKIYSKIIENELKIHKKSEKFKNDFEIIEKIQSIDNGFGSDDICRSKQIIEKCFKCDIEEAFIDEKYRFITRLRDKCLRFESKKLTWSDRIDKVFLNRYLAVPIFVVIMTLVYVLSVGFLGRLISDYFTSLIFQFKNVVNKWMTKIGASGWLVSLVVNGIISGLGSVLSFVPQLFILFLCISVLETSGYMSRIALIFDRLFRGVGLSGKALVPFIVGTGCSVPAISCTKTIENQKEREMAVILSPFVPCSAKLPIIALFSGYFFSDSSGFVTAAFYFFAILLICVCSIIMKKFIYRNLESSFVLELPEYKLPSVKYVSRDVFDKIKEFIFRAGSTIVFCSIAVWFLSSFNLKFQYCENIENSVMAKLGKLIAWFFYPIVGELNWGVSVSAIQGLIAKEQVVSSMSIIAGLSGLNDAREIFSAGIFSGFTKISAVSFVAFNLFSAPCIASIAAMKNELKSKKKLFFALLFQILIAWIISSLIYLIATNLM